MRQLAWLHAVPETARRTISEKASANRRDQKSRWQRMQDDGIAADLPEIRACEYLVAFLFQVGPTLLTPMGASPLTHGELRSFMTNTGLSLSAWEALTLRRLSADFLGESNRATEPSCPPPFASSVTSAERREAVAKKIDAYFG